MSPLAISLILISAFIHASWNLLAKRVPMRDEVFLIALVAGMVLLTPVGLVYASAFAIVPDVVWLLVIVAGAFQALYFTCLLSAYSHGDLSLAYPVARSSPLIVVTVMSVILGRGHEISLQAVVGIVVIVAAGFVLPMERLGQFRLKNYLNKMSAFALGAACGTAGYSILDDAALRVLRAPAVLGETLSVSEISLLYLFLESVSTVVWLAVWVGGRRVVRRRSTRETSIGSRELSIAVLMGAMIYATYGIVLISMAYAVNVSYIVAFRQVSLPIGVLMGLLVLKERGGILRFAATLVLVAGLVLIATG